MVTDYERIEIEREDTKNKLALAGLWLEGEVIENAKFLTFNESGVDQEEDYDDLPILRLTMKSGRVIDVINTGYEEYTGHSRGEYRAVLSVKEAVKE